MTEPMSRFFVTAYLALASCAASPPAKPPPDDRYYPTTVSFGADADTLLVGTCPGNAEDSGRCRIEHVDLARNRSVAFTAPPGRYLSMPAMGADGKTVIAVATNVKADKSGNRAARLIRFDPGMPKAAEMIVQSSTEVRLPSENQSGLVYWSRQCDPRYRYCLHNPQVRLSGEPQPHGIGRDYGFREIGSIFLDKRELYATGGFPVSADNAKYDVTSREDTNEFWQLVPSSKTGTRKVAQRGLSALAGASDQQGRILLIGEDANGLGLFEQSGAEFRRMADVDGKSTGGYLQSFAVSLNGRRVAVVMSFPSQGDRGETKLLLFDKPSGWRTVDVPTPEEATIIAIGSN